MVERLIGPKVVGVKQSLRVINNDQGKALYIAKDADNKLIDNVVASAKTHNLEIFEVDTMKELGRLCGIEVGAATAVILKE